MPSTRRVSTSVWRSPRGNDSPPDTVIFHGNRGSCQPRFDHSELSVVEPGWKLRPVVVMRRFVSTFTTTYGSRISGLSCATTSEPNSAISPGSGVWSTTMPSESGASGILDKGDRQSDLFRERAVASSIVNPMNSGTTTSSGPVETAMSTVVPGATSVPAVGLVEMTKPSSTSMLDSSVVVTTNPSASRAA